MFRIGARLKRDRAPTYKCSGRYRATQQSVGSQVKRLILPRLEAKAGNQRPHQDRLGPLSDGLDQETRMPLPAKVNKGAALSKVFPGWPWLPVPSPHCLDEASEGRDPDA